MLNPTEKKHIKDILQFGLGINPNINLPYYLNAIDSSHKEIQSIKAKLDQIMYNQKILDNKLDAIIELCHRH